MPTIHELAALASERPFASAMSNGDPCMAFWSSTPSRLDAAGGYKFCWSITPVGKQIEIRAPSENNKKIQASLEGKHEMRSQPEILFEIEQHTVLLRAEKQVRLVMVR